MRHITVIILFACVVQAHTTALVGSHNGEMNDLVDKLIQRLVKAQGSHNSDLHDTTLAKTHPDKGSRAQYTRATFPILQSFCPIPPFPFLVQYSPSPSGLSHISFPILPSPFQARSSTLSHFTSAVAAHAHGGNAVEHEDLSRSSLSDNLVAELAEAAAESEILAAEAASQATAAATAASADASVLAAERAEMAAVRAAARAAEAVARAEVCPSAAATDFHAAAIEIQAVAAAVAAARGLIQQATEATSEDVAAVSRSAAVRAIIEAVEERQETASEVELFNASVSASKKAAAVARAVAAKAAVAAGRAEVAAMGAAVASAVAQAGGAAGPEAAEAAAGVKAKIAAAAAAAAAGVTGAAAVPEIPAQTPAVPTSEATSESPLWRRDLDVRWVDQLGPSWAKFLQTELASEYFTKCMELVQEARQVGNVYPVEANVFKAFQLCPLERVRVVVVGQDPYHQPGQAMGLSFSVPRGVGLPPSLRNIYTEAGVDCGHGDLSNWAKQGVFLLNALLTVEDGKPMSHKAYGWEQFTTKVIEVINRERDGVIFLLWGKPAQKKAANVDRSRHVVFEATHPSPLSYHRGFRGCQHFSKTNEVLRQNHQPEICWHPDEMPEQERLTASQTDRLPQLETQHVRSAYQLAKPEVTKAARQTPWTTCATAVKEVETAEKVLLPAAIVTEAPRGRAERAVATETVGESRSSEHIVHGHELSNAAITPNPSKEADPSHGSPQIYLVDGTGFIHRAYHAMPSLTNRNGIPVGAVVGFTNMLLKLLRERNPDYLVVVFDTARKTFRNEIYPDYKATRPETPSDLIPQFNLTREACKAFDVPYIEKEGYEADDLIATYAHSQPGEVTIVSSDKDLMQLVGRSVRMLDPLKNRLIGIEEVKEKFGVPPTQVVDVQALCGDSSDNVPGVPGIGIKKASKLIQEYGTLENLLDNAEEVQGKQQELLLNYTKEALMSKKLVSLDDKVAMNESLEDFVVKPMQFERAAVFLKKYHLNAILQRLESEQPQEPKVEEPKPLLIFAKQAEEKPTEEAATEEKPVEAPKAEETPAEEPKAEEKPAEESSAEEKPVKLFVNTSSGINTIHSISTTALLGLFVCCGAIISLLCFRRCASTTAEVTLPIACGWSTC